MTHMVQGLLAYSRVGTDAKPFESIATEKILLHTLAHLEVAIQEAEAAITHDPLPVVMGDRVQLVQLFQNLLGNALKYRGDAPAQIHLSAHQDQLHWVFKIRDQGIGIDPKYRNRIFLIFQQLHTRHQYGGTGIGLALCRKIVEHHGGQTWVESELGQGSTFIFTIPIYQPTHDSLSP